MSLAPGVVARVVLVAALASLAGCSSGVETGYGRSRTASVNGTAALAALFRGGGHQVRAAVRLSDELAEWADVVVRFAPYPGPPQKEEAHWYDEWLNAQPGRRVVYVAREYDARADYWRAALEGLPKDAPERLRERIREAIDEAGKWQASLPPKPKEVATPEDWFAVKAGSKPGVVECTNLGGPWAVGVDAGAAKLVRREVFKLDSETPLLSCDGEPFVMAWTRHNGGRVLAVAGGTFLLNAALAARPARWPLAARVVDWAGYHGDEDDGAPGVTVPKRVAFVEGNSVNAGEAEGRSVFELLRLDPFGKVVAQLFALGLAACLARAPRLGRAAPDEPSGADRPVAHPEALGALLERTRQSAEARDVLATYRQWRSGPAARPKA